jgi:catechol 2,3-dioxygenase-like lactoylglutathione lyase family enzyme
MIGYTTFGSSDLARSGAFYDPIAAELGARRLFEDEHLILWGRGGAGMLGAITPHDKGAPSIGNGVMVALAARDPEQVRKVHALALSMGGPNEGDPGMRTGAFYGAYFRDPDGNKLAVFCMTKESVA